MKLKTKSLKNDHFVSFFFESSPNTLLILNQQKEILCHNSKALILLPNIALGNEPLSFCEAINCAHYKDERGCTPLRCIFNDLLNSTFDKKKGVIDTNVQSTICKNSTLVHWNYRLSTLYLPEDDLVLVQISEQEKSLIKDFSERYGGLIGNIELNHDLTNQRNDELVKQSVAVALSQIDKSQDFIWSVNREFEFILINTLAKKTYFQCFDSEIVIGMNALNCIPLQYRDVWKERYSRALNGEHFSKIEQFEIVDLPQFIRVSFMPIEIDYCVVGVSCIASDITSQKKVEMDVLQNEASLQSLIENTHDNIWSVDKSFRIVNSNSNFLTSFASAYGHNLVAGDNIIEYCPQSARQSWTERYTRSLNGERFTLVDTFPFNTFTLYVEISFNPILFDNEVVGVSCFSRDITRQQTQATELSKSKANLTAIIENTPDIIWSINRDYRIIISNSNYLNSYYFLAESDLQEVNLFDNGVHLQWKNRYDRALVGESFSEIMQFKNAESGESFFQITFNPIRVNDQIDGVVCFAHDITKLKNNEDSLSRSEAKLIEAQEVAKIGSWDVDYRINIGHWSDEVYHILGELKGEIEPTIANFLRHVPDEEREYPRRLYEDHLVHQQPYEIEYKIFLTSEEMKYVLVRCKSTFDDNGDVILTFGTIQDVTEQKMIELALKEADSMKTKLFSVIAHDLRAPFHTLLGFTEILSNAAEENDLTSVVEYSDIIKRAGENMYALLTNLLDWSNSQVGRSTFFLENVPLSPLVSDIDMLLRNVLHQKQIVLMKEFDVSLELFCDKNMLSTILRNLISNAIKFSYEKGSIYLKIVEEEGSFLFSVQDEGVGMSKHQADILLVSSAPFTTVGTNNEKGTGIGLMLCKEFVERHKGKIWIQSEKGKGTTFFFTIPK